MRAAYDALDAAERRRLARLSAYHSLYYSQGRAGYLPSRSDERGRLHPVRLPRQGAVAPTAGEGPPRHRSAQPAHRPPRPRHRRHGARRVRASPRRAQRLGMPGSPGLLPPVGGRRRRGLGQPPAHAPRHALRPDAAPAHVAHPDRRRPARPSSPSTTVDGGQSRRRLCSNQPIDAWTVTTRPGTSTQLPMAKPHSVRVMPAPSSSGQMLAWGRYCVVGFLDRHLVVGQRRLGFTRFEAGEALVERQVPGHDGEESGHEEQQHRARCLPARPDRRYPNAPDDEEAEEGAVDADLGARQPPDGRGAVADARTVGLLRHGHGQCSLGASGWLRSQTGRSERMGGSGRSKFSGGGGDDVPHSRVWPSHGLSPARLAVAPRAPHVPEEGQHRDARGGRRRWTTRG